MPLYHDKWRSFLNEGVKRPLTEEELLAEGRKDDVKKKYPELADRGLIDELSLEDPSGNNAYLGWMAKQIAKFFKDETAYAPREQFIAHVLNATRSFHSNKQRLKNKDLNQYKTVADLNQALDALGLTSKDKRRQQRAREKEILADKSEIVFENDDIFAVRPLNKEASCIIGQQTKWCIAATKSRNYWYDYASGRNTTDNDGIPRAFVMVKLNNLDESDSDYKIALEYKAEPYGKVEFANAWDAVDDAQDEDHFNQAVAINILNGALGEENGLAFYNRLHRNFSSDDLKGTTSDEDLETVAKYLNDNYADDFGIDKIEVDKDEEDWQDEVRDELQDSLHRIGSDIIYAGATNIENLPPEMDFTEHEEILRKANQEVKDIGFGYEDYGWDGAADVMYKADLVFEFPGLNWNEDVDIDDIHDVALNIINSNSRMYISSSDDESLSSDWGSSGDDLTLYFTYTDEEREYDPSPEDLQRWISDVKDGFDMEDLKADMLDAFAQEGLTKGKPGQITPSDVVATLEQTLKNFDQIDFEDGEITAYGDVVVQIPRMPKKFFELSKQLGTKENPGPLYKFKETITGPFRNANETLIDFLTMQARKTITDLGMTQSFKSAVHRLFGSLGNEAEKQKVLDFNPLEDLFEEKADPESYMMGDFDFNLVNNQLAYDPVSGKLKVPFYIAFKARSNPEWNIKFVQLADKYWRSIEDAYELNITQPLENAYKKEEVEIDNIFLKAKEKESKQEKEGPIVKNARGERMVEHFQGWRNFLK
jgi:hypothetical protein